MHLRPIEAADLETIRALRNRYRQWFFDNREITRETHTRWFKALATKPIDFFVIEDDGRVVGTISVTTSADGMEIGNLLLDPECRGRGIMRHAVAELTAEPGRYVAHVKNGNTPSERVFLASGFDCSPGAVESEFKKIVEPPTVRAAASRD